MLKYLRYGSEKSLVDLPEDYEETIQNVKFLCKCLEGGLNYLNQSSEKFPSSYCTQLRHCKKAIDADYAFLKGVSFQDLPLLLRGISSEDKRKILHGIDKVSNLQEGNLNLTHRGGYSNF